ncbi:cytosolic carboxypeptidase 2 isoform X8 [Physeter macrocephalus]|uniref:Cytosolic carboxypeptidase 2 n=1 Tax=Physeter macrocephalus TaxID=9755 RepID=A0A9W2X7T5_PHYMC|nr:cytosolic carboxypeptidase 2 isoform X8 [Physeter catodon]
MFPALQTELKQQTLPDPYEDFMYHHLQYYGYFKGPTCLSSTVHRQIEAVSRDSLMLTSPLLKSRQLLHDDLGEVNSRLREPRDLFAFFSSSGPLQAPRWPIECEVIKENIHHIEWVPPQPEYFYQPTGNEKVPEIVGEEKGTVVYQLDSVPTEDSYFTSSRVGGKRGIIKELAVTLQGPEDNTLLFESRFESGNLQKAVRVNTYEYELTLRTDLYTNKHAQWFYFRVQNTRKDVTYRFTIVNLLKPKSLYTIGMKPLMYSQLDASTHSVGWRREGNEIRLLEEREVLLYCDFHGHSRKSNIFLYGCNNKDRKFWLHERVFPLMLSKNAPDKFSFHSCNFKVQKCKEGTGRVVMWRMGILNSYTMESTFGGSTLGNKRDTHFTPEDLKSLGYHVCDTLLDFCDPDRSKFMQCLAELKELLQQEIHKKFKELGQDMDLEGSWSDISLSDIESSTSGSDSSLSDGLPRHLLNTAHELNQKKKMYKKKKRKPLQSRKQRNKQYQKSNLMQESKLTEDAPEGAGFASTLQKQPAFFKNSENTSSSMMKNEKPRLNELNGRDNGTSLGPSKMTTLILTKNKERMQREKPGFTVSCSPKRNTNPSQEPAPDTKPNWPRNRYPATKGGRTTAVAAKMAAGKPVLEQTGATAHASPPASEMYPLLLKGKFSHPSFSLAILHLLPFLKSPAPSQQTTLLGRSG